MLLARAPYQWNHGPSAGPAIAVLFMVLFVALIVTAAHFVRKRREISSDDFGSEPIGPAPRDADRALLPGSDAVAAEGEHERAVDPEEMERPNVPKAPRREAARANALERVGATETVVVRKDGVCRACGRPADPDAIDNDEWLASGKFWNDIFDRLQIPVNLRTTKTIDGKNGWCRHCGKLVPALNGGFRRRIELRVQDLAADIEADKRVWDERGLREAVERANRNAEERYEAAKARIAEESKKDRLRERL